MSLFKAASGIIFFFGLHLTLGQSSQDSLWNIWSDSLQSDHIRLQSIHELATKPEYNTTTDRKLYLAQLQYAHAQKVANKAHLAKAKHTLGQCYSSLNAYDLALDCFKESIRIRMELEEINQLLPSLEKIAKMFIASRKFDDGISYHFEWLEQLDSLGSKIQGYDSILFFLHYNLGTIYRHKASYDAAIEHFELAIDFVTNGKDTALLTKAYYELAKVYFYKGNYAAAIDYLARGLTFAEQQENRAQIAFFNFNIAVIYFYQEDYDKALEKYIETQNYMEEVEDNQSLIQVYNNIADIHVVKKQFIKAFSYYKLGMDLAKEQKSDIKIAMLYLGMGKAHLAQSQYDAALSALNKAIAILDPMEGTERFLSEALFEKGQIKLTVMDLDKAIQFGTASLDLAQEIGNLETVMSASELLYRAYSKKQQYQKALHMHELYLRSRDSLNSTKNQRALIRQEYEYEQKAYIDSLDQAKELFLRDGQALLKDLQIKKEKRQNQFLWVILLLAFIATLFFFYRFHTIKRQKAIIGKQRIKILTNLKKLQEKNLRNQMNPHFIFNTINNIQYFMFLKGERETNKYFVYFSKLIRHTLDMSNSDLTNLNDEIDYLKSYMELEKMRMDGNLEIDLKVSESLNTNDIKIPCMLLQPIVENAIKHGLKPKKSDRKLNLSFSAKDQRLDILITDNGIGREATINWNVPIEKKQRSWATFILKERIKIFNFEKERKLKFKIVDLKDGDRSLGTQVCFSIPLEH